MHDLQTVPERVLQVDARHARFRVWATGNAVRLAVRLKRGKVSRPQSGMSLGARHEFRGHADVQLPTVRQGKPAPAPTVQGGRFAKFREAQERAVKCPCLGLATGRRFDENVIQAADQGGHVPRVGARVEISRYFPRDDNCTPQRRSVQPVNSVAVLRVSLPTNRLRVPSPFASHHSRPPLLTSGPYRLA